MLVYLMCEAHFVLENIGASIPEKKMRTHRNPNNSSNRQEDKKVTKIICSQL